MAGGRPTKYCQEILDKTQDYLDNFKTKYGDEFPGDIGLALVLGVNRDTVREWKSHADKPEFSGLLEQILCKQHQIVWNSSLTGKHNSTMAKLLLASRYGYSDRQEMVLEGNSGKPVELKWAVNVIDGASKD